jgi:hypothetical protein
MSDGLYNSLRTLVDDCIVRERNFRKSPNHLFQKPFLVKSRNTAVRRKLRRLEIARKLLKSAQTKERVDKINAKRLLILSLSERIFDHQALLIIISSSRIRATGLNFFKPLTPLINFPKLIRKLFTQTPVLSFIYRFFL